MSANTGNNPPVQPQVTAVSRSPGGALTGTLDYSKKAHMAIYTMATKGLEPRYNGDPAYLLSFLASVSSQATVCDWTDILTFGTKKFFQDYGTIKPADMKAQATTYTEAVITRDSQDSAMMALFLENSVDQNLFSKLLNIAPDYTVNGQKD